MSPADDRPCAKWLPLLHGYVDRELDAEHALRVERHLAEHPACAAELQRIRQLRQMIGGPAARLAAPDGLAQRISRAIAAETAGSRRGAEVGWLEQIGAWLAQVQQFLRRFSLPISALAVATMAFVLTVQTPGPILAEQDLVTAHVRSLLVEHLTDVTTSDRHTVKPWFAGRVNFSPPVVDLAAEGFPLVGGRLDYVAGRVVVALAYRHNGHVINLFLWPGAPPTVRQFRRDGFNLLTWAEDDLVAWAVSDVTPDELAEFARRFQARSKAADAARRGLGPA